MKFNLYKTFVTDSVIYGIKNINTNKWYIGSCVNFRLRIRRHYYYLKHQCHHSSKLLRSWNKYGESAFDLYILYTNTTLSIKELLKLEEKYIQEYDSFQNGYNMTDKCMDYKLFQLTKELIQKFTQSRVKPVVAINRKTNELIGEYDSVSKAAIAFKDLSTNISSCCKHKLNYVKDTVFVYKSEYDPNIDYRTEGHCKGLVRSEELKLKYRQCSTRVKPVYKYDLNKNLIETYYSKREAERLNNITKDCLRINIKDQIKDGFLYSYNKYEKDIV